MKTRVLATVCAIVAIAAPAQARRTVIDFDLIPDFIRSSSIVYGDCNSNFCTGTLPFKLETSVGPSGRFYVNGNGVISFNQPVANGTTLSALVNMDVQFISAFYSPGDVPGVSFGITSYDDVLRFARNQIRPYGFDPAIHDRNTHCRPYICAETPEEFIALNGLERYVDDVVLFAGGATLFRKLDNETLSVELFQTSTDAGQVGANLPGTSFVSDYNQASTNVPYRFNVNLATGVPEPSTWAAMIVGFLAIGASMRRKDRLVLAING